MVWTDERVELLKKFWSEGLSASQIALRMSGISRNAVIGKVHRLGLAGRPAASRPHTHRPGGRRSAAPKQPSHGSGPASVASLAFRALYAAELPGGPSIPNDEPAIFSADSKTLQDLGECHCRWPVGDPQKPGFHFCGKEKVPGLPYCETHARRAYQAPVARRRDYEPARPDGYTLPPLPAARKPAEPAGT